MTTDPQVRTAHVVTNRPLPAFSDRELTERTRLHSPRCAGALTESGDAPTGSCRCVSATAIVPRGTSGLVLVEEPGTVLVRFSSYSAAWFEGAGLTFTGRPTDQALRGTRARGLPPDHLLLENALIRGLPKYPRRRRRPRGGEIVFIREQLRTGELAPFRFLLQAPSDTLPVAVLCDTSMRPDQVLMMNWNQAHTIELPKGIDTYEAVLVPAFPLPDGTEDPGWLPS